MVGKRSIRDEWVFRRCASEMAASKVRSRLRRDHRHTVAPATSRLCIPSGRLKREVGKADRAHRQNLPNGL